MRTLPIVALLVLTSAAYSGEKGTPPTPAIAPKVKAPADNRSRPYRVIADRTVSFPVQALTFSPDRRLLATAGAQYAPGTWPVCKIVLVDVATGQTLREIQTGSSLVNRFVFSPDGKRFYAGQRRNDLSVYGGAAELFVCDVATGQILKTFQTALWDLSPDGKTLATASNVVDIDPGFRGREKAIPPTFSVQLLDTASWKEVSRLDDKNATVHFLSFAPDGKRLGLACSGYSIRIWDWQARKEIVRFQAPEMNTKGFGGGQITWLVFSPDSKSLASVTDHTSLFDRPREIVLWQADTGKKVRTIDGVMGPVVGLTFTPKGDKIVAADRQGEHIYVFDAGTGKLEKKQGPPARPDLALALYRDGMIPGQIPEIPELGTRLWNLGTGSDILSDTLPDNPQSLALSPDGRTLAIGDYKGIIRQYDVDSSKEIRRFGDPGGWDHRFGDTGRVSTVFELTYLANGKLLASSHRHGDVRLWEAETGEFAKHQYVNRRRGDQIFAISADGKLATADRRWVRISANMATQIPIEVTTSPSIVSQMKFTPDGKSLLIGDWEGKKVQVIDIATATIARTIGRDDGGSFALSPDGKTVAIFSRKKTAANSWSDYVTLWDFATGQELWQIMQISGGNGGLVFTSDGSGLFVSRSDGFGLWEVSSGQLRAFVPGNGPISVSKNGRICATKGVDCFTVWDLTGRNNGGILDATPLSPKELAKLWADLKRNPGDAFRAIWRLAGVPEQTVPYLKEKLRGVTAPNSKRVAVLIADLDSDDVSTRERASEELPQHGRAALLEAKAALAKDPELRTRGRLQNIFRQLYDYPCSPEQILATRIVETLEQTGTADARRLLETLAVDERPQFPGPARAALARFRK